MNLYKVMVTAHRDLIIQDQEIIKTAIIAEVDNPEVGLIYFGGAVGGDSLALEVALSFRESLRPKLVVVLLKTAKDQRPDLHELTKKADEIVELKLSRKMYADIWWEHSQKCIAFWDGIEAGGTYNAMRYAIQHGKEIQHVKVTGRNK